MRLSEFAGDNPDRSRDLYANVVTALSLMQNQIKDKKLKAEIPTDMVLRYIRNTGMAGFSYQDLVAANSQEPAMKSIVKNITPDTVTVNTDTAADVENPDELAQAVDNPEQVVSNMAKDAMARRQD
jgi:hypothetical protein